MKTPHETYKSGLCDNNAAQLTQLMIVGMEHINKTNQTIKHVNNC